MIKQLINKNVLKTTTTIKLKQNHIFQRYKTETTQSSQQSLATGVSAPKKLSKTNAAADDEDIEEKLERPSFLIETIDEDKKNMEIEMKRNKSRLLPQHRRMLNNELPYAMESPQSWIHTTVKYKRMMIGRYGLETTGIDPRLCFLSKAEQAERDEYERVAQPKTLPQMIAINQKQLQDKRQKMIERENDIVRKMDKLKTWEMDLKSRISKKEQDARVIKERKERLVEEVRRQFGFKLDARDERFKELLAQKEKEDKKKQKEARRQAREEKMLAKLQEKTKEFHTDANKSSGLPAPPPVTDM